MQKKEGKKLEEDLAKLENAQRDTKRKQEEDLAEFERQRLVELEQQRFGQESFQYKEPTSKKKPLRDQEQERLK